ncbi:MAG TPA: cytochrome c-type biogenesis protein CcmH [Candidatus Dormibacteraeota bacterium]|nr:cytochrome c-type biogenesis protein CcmH [Candidatus Dormibacteraeota bacterium]
MSGRTPFSLGGLAALLLAAAAALAVAATSGSESSGSLEQRTQAVAATLKCPVCHDLSAADSPAPVAQQMRAQIARELRAGRTPDQIRAEFVAAYGEWILLSPPRGGVDLLPWLAPALLGLAGLALVAGAIRRWIPAEAGSPPAPELSDADRHLVEQALASAGSEVE